MSGRRDLMQTLLARLVFRRLLSTAVIGLLAYPVASCHGQADEVLARNKSDVTLRIGFPQTTGQDPLRGMQQASRLLTFEGLIGNSRDGRTAPRLAESWTVSADGLSWTFTLRSNAKFHDGSPVDAASVKQSLDRSLASLTDRGLLPGLQDIVGIETKGPHEIVVRLSKPSTFLLGDLEMVISKQGANGAPIGTGPFVTTQSSPQQITMSMFPDHYLGTPEVRQIVWKPYPTLRTAWAGMMRGEIDFLYEVSQDAVEFVQGELSVKTFSVLRPYVFGVVFNSSRQPLRDKNVRHALNFAVNRETIVHQALKGRGVVAHSPLWPANWAYDSSFLGYSYDPGRAAAMIDRTHGHTTANSGKHASARPTRLRFTCLVIENLALWERMALLVQKQLFEIGVDMKLEAVPAAQFNERVAQGNFDAVFLELSGFSMSRPYAFWHSASTRNWFGYQNSDVDKSLDAIRRALDDESYRAGVSELQRSLIADPPAIFLAWGQTVRAVSDRFQVTSEPDRDILLTLSRWRPTSPRAEATH